MTASPNESPAPAALEAAAAPVQTGFTAVQKRTLAIVFMTVFLDMIGFGLVIPLLPFYVEDMGGSPRVVGALLSGFSAMQLLATPAMGRMSDRLGRRRVILFSLAGNGLAMLIFAAATSFKLVPLLFVSRLLAGATAGNLSACQATIADVTEGEWRARGMGLLGAGIGLGMVAGPLIGGALHRLAPWAPPVAAALMAAVDFVGAIVWLPETHRPVAAVAAAEAKSGGKAEGGEGPSVGGGTLREVVMQRPIAVVLLLYFFTFLCLTNLQVAYGLLAARRLGWTPREVGYAFGLVGAIMLVVQAGLLGRLVRAFGEATLVKAGAVVIGAGMLTISAASSAAVLLVGTALMSLGFGVTNPLLGTLAAQRAGEAHRGVVLGLAQSSGGLARTVGPLWGSYLFASVGPGAPFVSGAVAAGVSLVIGLVSLRERRG